MNLLYLLRVKLNILILFDYGSFNKICDKIEYLISEKSDITNSVNYNFVKIRIGSYNTLPIKKTITFHKVITLIKSVINKNKNKYYNNILLEKCSYKYKYKKQYFLMNVCLL